VVRHPFIVAKRRCINSVVPSPDCAALFVIFAGAVDTVPRAVNEETVAVGS
jgi:hypothetical protein